MFKNTNTLIIYHICLTLSTLFLSTLKFIIVKFLKNQGRACDDANGIAKNNERVMDSYSIHKPRNGRNIIVDQHHHGNITC